MQQYSIVRADACNKMKTLDRQDSAVTGWRSRDRLYCKNVGRRSDGVTSPVVRQVQSVATIIAYELSPRFRIPSNVVAMNSVFSH